MLEKTRKNEDRHSHTLKGQSPNLGTSSRRCGLLVSSTTQRWDRKTNRSSFSNEPGKSWHVNHPESLYCSSGRHRGGSMKQCNGHARSRLSCQRLSTGSMRNLNGHLQPQCVYLVREVVESAREELGVYVFPPARSYSYGVH